MSEQDTDTEELPYQCELCDERFATREQLRAHAWEFHEMGGDIPP